MGKSSSNDIFLDGDLFYQLNTNHLFGTENIILRTEYGNEIFAKYDEILKNYLDWAWIIPVESGDAKKLERLLGDELINKKVPILIIIPIDNKRLFFMIILVITVKMEENLGKKFLNKCIVRF